MKRVHSPVPVAWFVASGFVILGLLIQCCLIGYSFTALICYGIGGVILLYRLLARLGSRSPGLARVLRLILTVCLCLGLVAAAVTGLVIYRASLGSPGEDCAYLVILGAGVNGTVPSLSLKNRLDAACAYLEAFPDTVCVVSGCQGSGEDISEAQCMYQELVRMGIDSSRIWMEDQATNTRENLKFSLDLIQNKTGIRPDRIGIVSSEYHLYRAHFFAGEQGVESIGIPGKTTWFTLRLNYYLREIAAVWYYVILGG